MTQIGKGAPPGGLPGGRVWAVVPVKDLSEAKQRLSPVLSPQERRGLFSAMLRDVLCALTAVRRLDGVLIVTGDPDAAKLAGNFQAEILEETHNLGHSAAVKAAADLLARRRAASMLTLPADVPLVSARELSKLLAAHGPAPAVTVAPSRDERGTNALICSPPDVISFCFGENSFASHLAAARRLGVVPRMRRLPGLALDIDAPPDLRTLAATSTRTHAYRFLRGCGLIERLLSG